MKTLKIFIILLFLLAFKSYANSTLVKENTYGKLTSYPDEAKLVFIGSYGKINIIKADSSLKYTFYDGSYIYIDLSKNLLKRYSAKLRRTESFTSQTYPTILWNVNSRVKSSFNQFKNFTNTPDMKDKDPNPCDNLPGPCDYHPLDNDLEINLINDMESRFSTASSTCSTERSNLINRGFNGHSSLERCRLSSTLGVVATGVGVIGCMIEPSKWTCGIAIPSYASALVNHGDVSQSCVSSYIAAHKALETCEANNGGGSSGGGGGGEGSTGGSHGNGGVGGGGSFKRVCYSVVTGGGVTSWCDFKPV
jgi:uncharacterized membrane protein YgcG